MNVYKVVLSVIDFEDVGEQGIRDMIEGAHYPNRCISPQVLNIESRDIGEWNDSHPLNNKRKARSFFDALFDDDIDTCCS
jgi:hypothetical protein